MIDLSFITQFGLSKNIIIFVTDVIIILLVTFIIYKRISHQKKISSDPHKNNIKPNIVITSRDIRAIAGDDVMVTQLDLARAYIELGKKKLAKQILDHVIKHGNPSQQQSARQLMAAF
jgi:FimV-like protein